MSATYCPITLTAGIRRAHEQLARLRWQHEAVLRGMKDKNLVAAHEYARQLKRAECAMASALMVEALDLEARTPKPLIVRDDLNKPKETPTEAMQTAQAMLEKFHRMCPPAPGREPFKGDPDLAAREKREQQLKFYERLRERIPPNPPADSEVPPGVDLATQEHIERLIKFYEQSELPHRPGRIHPSWFKPKDKPPEQPPNQPSACDSRPVRIYIKDGENTIACRQRGLGRWVCANCGVVIAELSMSGELDVDPECGGCGRPVCRL